MNVEELASACWYFKQKIDFAKISEEFRTKLLKAMFEHCNQNTAHTADMLGLKRTTLVYMLHERGIRLKNAQEKKEYCRCPDCGRRLERLADCLDIPYHKCLDDKPYVHKPYVPTPREEYAKKLEQRYDRDEIARIRKLNKAIKKETY